MEKRTLGKTGHKSTLITLGGASIRQTTRRESDDFKYALSHGVNHIDVAPTYGNGTSEVILGGWVNEHRRDLFVACKTQKRTEQEAAEELQKSLRNLQTDFFDLYQLHALDEPEELRIALSEGGAMSAISEAKEQGFVRHIGITSHNPVNIVKALKRYDFDTVLLPVNYVLRAHSEPRNDYETVLSIARKRELGVIAMKAAAKGPWLTDERPYNTWYQPFDTQMEVDEAIRFTLSQYVTTAASSSDIRIAKMMIEAAERYTPIKEKEQLELLRKASSYKALFP